MKFSLVLLITALLPAMAGGGRAAEAAEEGCPEHVNTKQYNSSPISEWDLGRNRSAEEVVHGKEVAGIRDNHSRKDPSGGNFSPLYRNFQEGATADKSEIEAKTDDAETVVFAGGAFVKNGGFTFKSTRVPLGWLLGEVGGVTPAGEGDIFVLHRDGERLFVDSKNVNFPLQDGDFVFAFEKLALDK